MNQRKDLDDKLDSIKKVFDEQTQNPSNDFVDDYLVFQNLLNDKFENLDDGFWNYFHKKYDLPDVSMYFKSTNETLHTVFNECIHPFYLRLDILPNYNSKYTSISEIYSVSWNLKRLVVNNWLTLVALALAGTFFILALSVIDGNQFQYDLYMSLGTGFSIAFIISTINNVHKKQMRKRIEELNRIFYTYDRLKKEYDSLHKSMTENVVNEKTEFVSKFCLLNNELERFLKNTSNLTSIKTSSIYHRLVDFEKLIFEYSSRVVRKDFVNYVMDQTTDEEITKLQLYVVQLGYWLDFFESDIASVRYYYDKDISRMSDKQL